VGLFISAGSLAGAFGGLIAYGVTSITGSPMPQYKILFLIEGLPSFVLAIAVALFMPSRPEKSRLLNEEERTLVLTRLNRDISSEGQGIDWNGVIRCLVDPKTYVVSIAWVILVLEFLTSPIRFSEAIQG
jgi:MFS family permease